MATPRARTSDQTDGGALRTGQPAAERARQRLLAGLPVTERRLQLAGVSTALLEGGQGPPLLLLHGPGEYGAKWFQLIPELVAEHRVIVPDLPGHGASEAFDHPPDAERVLTWLGELIERTCPAAPTLLGHVLGGAIAARFASRRGDRLAATVLVDTLGLAPFQPAPAFGQALGQFLAQPTEASHDALWQQCAFDLDALRARLGERWDWMKAYTLDRALDSSLHVTQHALMGEFGMPAIPPGELRRITVPTTLIWGRNDLATPLSVAQAASADYGWKLHVIENAADDPPMEQPAAFLQTLRTVLQ